MPRTQEHHKAKLSIPRQPHHLNLEPTSEEKRALEKDAQGKSSEQQTVSSESLLEKSEQSWPTKPSLQQLIDEDDDWF